MDKKDVAVTPLEILWDDSEERRVYRRVHLIKDMTPEAATAMKEAARYQFEVPAKERTKQVGIETVGRLGLASLLVIVACVHVKDTAQLTIVIVAIAAIFGGKPLIDAIFKKGD